MTADIPIRCENCGVEPTLKRNPEGRLFVGCGCKARDVRVSEVLPEVWADE